LKLKFNGTVLAERFFNPKFGDPGCQIQRRQPFGTKGTLEQRGFQAGQAVIVPVHLVFGSYEELNEAVNAIYAMCGTNGDLELEFAKSTRKLNGSHSVGKATLDSVTELRERSAFVYHSELKKPGWHAMYALTFFTLEPPGGAKKGGFGR